jgi:hypothetical protein
MQERAQRNANDKPGKLPNKQIFSHKTPLELEALATMDFIANSILEKNASDETIISKFKEIKGDKFNNTLIQSVLSELKRLQLIAA